MAHSGALTTPDALARRRLSTGRGSGCRSSVLDFDERADLDLEIGEHAIELGGLTCARGDRQIASRFGEQNGEPLAGLQHALEEDDLPRLDAHAPNDEAGSDQGRNGLCMLAPPTAIFTFRRHARLPAGEHSIMQNDHEAGHR